MRHAVLLNQTEHELWLGRTAHGGHALHALGEVVPVSLSLGADGSGLLRLGDQAVPVVVAAQGDTLFIHLDGINHELRLRHPLERAAGEARAGGDDSVRAPMPGTAVSVAVGVGDAVSRGTPLLVMESMKLETTLTAPRDAVVQSVRVSPGQAFERDAVLVVLASAEAA